MEFVKPIPFAEAVEKLSDRNPVKSSLNSAGWQRVPVAHRERAFFSSTVENARFLSTAKNDLLDFLNAARNDNDALKITRAEFVDKLQKLAIDLGIPATGTGDLQDVKKQQRLELIFDTNIKAAQDYGYWKQGQDPDVLAAFPAQRFIRVQDVRVPRKYHEQHEGEVHLKWDLPFWLSMNPDFGVPWGPWGFNSGMDVEDVDREEAEAQGLLKPGDAVMPMDKPFNDALAASLRGLDENSKQFLAEAFGDQVEFGENAVHWRVSEDLRQATGGWTPEQLADATGKIAALLHGEKKSVVYGAVDKSIADAIQHVSDIDAHGMNHSMENNFVVHARKRHGIGRERRTDQIAITDADFKLVPDIVSKPDRILSGGLSRRGRRAVIYQKTFPDGTIYFIEEEWHGKKEMTAKTMWKKKKVAGE